MQVRFRGATLDSRKMIVIALTFLSLLWPAPGFCGDDDAKQRAAEQMRRIAKAIKECSMWADKPSPPPPANQCFGIEVEAGPPVNVVWNLQPSKTDVRAPYEGSLEFDLAASWSLDPLQPTDQKVAKRCKRNFQIEAQGAATWAQASLSVALGVGDDVTRLGRRYGTIATNSTWGQITLNW